MDEATIVRQMFDAKQAYDMRKILEQRDLLLFINKQEETMNETKVCTDEGRKITKDLFVAGLVQAGTFGTVLLKDAAQRAVKQASKVASPEKIGKVVANTVVTGMKVTDGVVSTAKNFFSRIKAAYKEAKATPDYAGESVDSKEE